MLFEKDFWIFSSSPTAEDPSNRILRLEKTNTQDFEKPRGPPPGVKVFLSDDGLLAMCFKGHPCSSKVWCGLQTDRQAFATLQAGYGGLAASFS